MTRRVDGISLVETLVAMVLALVVAGAASELMVRGVSLEDAALTGGGLQQDVRLMVEQLVRDVSSSQRMLESGRGKGLMAVHPSDDDATRHAASNPSWSFPFTEDGQDTLQRMPAIRVSYTWDATRRELVRLEESGTLVSGTRGSATLTEFSFEPREALSRKACRPVQVFDARAIGYDGEKIAEVPWSRAAGVLLHVAARPDEGAYASGRRVPSIEVVTKAWSTARVSDQMYPEYFSSTDDDTSW